MTIIELEKQLLMISKTEKKFKLGMNDLIKLKEYMKKVGEITNIFFESQIEYANLIRNDDKYEELLKAYHKKLSEDIIDVDLDDIRMFVETINS